MTLMTLGDFEQHCQKAFAERLLVIRDVASDAEAERLITDMFNELEAVAVAGGVEACKRGAFLLTLALYDIHLSLNADALGVEPDYFDGDRPQEQEAFNYLHERRCGAPARQFITVN
jgi:hypothetical protein